MNALKVFDWVPFCYRCIKISKDMKTVQFCTSFRLVCRIQKKFAVEDILFLKYLKSRSIKNGISYVAYLRNQPRFRARKPVCKVSLNSI